MQCNRKTEERSNHRDRDARLRGIGAEVRKYVREGVPVSVNDMKNYERAITVNRLRVTCRPDRRKYWTGRKVSAAHLMRSEFQASRFLGEKKSPFGPAVARQTLMYL